jgi:hypothetical protein
MHPETGMVAILYARFHQRVSPHRSSSEAWQRLQDRNVD